MAENLKGFIISFTLVTLFIFAIVNFGNQFQLDMKANETILNESDSQLNQTYYNAQYNLTEGEDLTNTSMIGVKGEQFQTEGGEITYTSIPKTAFNFWGTVSGTFKMFGNLLVSTIDLSVIVLSAIASIIGITLIYLFWKTIRTGN